MIHNLIGEVNNLLLRCTNQITTEILLIIIIIMVGFSSQNVSNLPPTHSAVEVHPCCAHPFPNLSANSQCPPALHLRGQPSTTASDQKRVDQNGVGRRQRTIGCVDRRATARRTRQGERENGQLLGCDPVGCDRDGRLDLCDTARAVVVQQCEQCVLGGVGEVYSCE